MSLPWLWNALVRHLKVPLRWQGVYRSPEIIGILAGIYMVLAGSETANGKWSSSSYKLLDIGQSDGASGKHVYQDRESCWNHNKPAGTTLLFKMAPMLSSQYDETDRKIVECCLRAHNRPLPCGNECNLGYNRDETVEISNTGSYTPLLARYKCA